MDYHVQTVGSDFDLDEVVDLVSRIYGPNYYDAKRIHGWLLSREPTLSPDNFVLARAKSGDLIGLVRIVIRGLHFGASTLACGGISTVGIHGAWRRRGIATLLMREADEAMRRKGLDFAFLHARQVLDGFYTRVGYWGINRYLHLEMINSASNGCELLPVPLKEESVGKIELAYDSEYGGLAGSMVRNRDMWPFLLGKAALVRPPFLVHECRVKSSGEFAGYLVVSGDTLHEAVIEKGYFSSVPKALEDLKVRFLAIHPFHPLFVYLRSTYSTTMTERFAVDGGYMGKILNLESCLNKYANFIRKKWQGAGIPIRNMRLCGFELDFDRGLVQKTEEEDDLLFADQRTCLWFLLGILQPNQMSGVKIHSKFRSLDLVNLSTGFHTSAWDAF